MHFLLHFYLHISCCLVVRVFILFVILVCTVPLCSDCVICGTVCCSCDYIVRHESTVVCNRVYVFCCYVAASVALSRDPCYMPRETFLNGMFGFT